MMTTCMPQKKYVIIKMRHKEIISTNYYVRISAYALYKKFQSSLKLNSETSNFKYIIISLMRGYYPLNLNVNE